MAVSDRITGTNYENRNMRLHVKELYIDDVEFVPGDVPSIHTEITAGEGLTGGGDLSENRTIGLSSASQASLALADTAVQPARTISAGTGLTGGGDLSANRTIALSTDTAAAVADAAVLRRFATVAAMLASTKAGVATGALWQAGQYLYKQAASGATDYDLETAGGVRLVALELPTGGFSVLQFGVLGANDQNLFLKAVKRGGRVGKLVVVPEGAYNFSAPCELNTTTLGFSFRNIYIEGTVPGRAHGYSPCRIMTASGVDAFIITKDNDGTGNNPIQEHIHIKNLLFRSVNNDDTGYCIKVITPGAAQAFYTGGFDFSGCAILNKAGFWYFDNLMTQNLVGYRFFGRIVMNNCHLESTAIIGYCNLFLNHITMDGCYFHNGHFEIGPWGGGYWTISDCIIASARPTMFNFATGNPNRYPLRVNFHNLNGEGSGDSTAPAPNPGPGTWRRDMLVKYEGEQYGNHEFVFTGMGRVTGVEEDQTTVPKMSLWNYSTTPMKIVPKGAILWTPERTIVQAPDIASGTQAKHFFFFVPLDVAKNRSGPMEVAFFNNGVRPVASAHRQIKRLSVFPGIGTATPGYYGQTFTNIDGKKIFAVTQIMQVDTDGSPFATPSITINGVTRNFSTGYASRAGVYQCVLGIALDPGDEITLFQVTPLNPGAYPVSVAMGAFYDDLQPASDYLIPNGCDQFLRRSLATGTNTNIRVPGTNTSSIANGLSGTLRVEINDGLLGSGAWRFEVTSAGLVQTPIYLSPGSGITFNPAPVSIYDMANVNVANATGSDVTVKAYLSWDAAAAGLYTPPAILSATATYDPPELAAGAADSIQTITLTGAALGDVIDASFSLDLQGVSLRAWVSASNTVKYQFFNPTAAAVDLGSGTVKVQRR